MTKTETATLNRVIDDLEIAKSRAGDAGDCLRELVSEAEGETESLQTQATEHRHAMEHLETRYPRLFRGDLSKLDHGERKDLFESISALILTPQRDTDAEKTIARIDGKL